MKQITTVLTFDAEAPPPRVSPSPSGKSIVLTWDPNLTLVGTREELLTLAMQIGRAAGQA